MQSMSKDKLELAMEHVLIVTEASDNQRRRLGLQPVGDPSESRYTSVVQFTGVSHRSQANNPVPREDAAKAKSLKDHSRRVNSCADKTNRLHWTLPSLTIQQLATEPQPKSATLCTCNASMASA